MFKKLLPFIIIFTVVLILYYPALTTYFSQDDFFMFKISQTDGTLKGFFNLFGIYPFEERGIAFYRPIFREALHNIYFSVFGLNHLPFRILLFILHFINIYLVYTLIQSIFKKKFISLFAAFFFGMSAANVSTLYYLAGGIEASGATMFALLTLISYKKYLEILRIKFKILSLILAILAFSTHEIIISLPLILLGLTFLVSPAKKAFKQSFRLWPFFLILVFFLYIDIFKIGFSPNEEQYKFIFNAKIFIQSFIWYTSWAFGLPEMLIDFVLPGLKLNPNLMRYWGDFYSIIFTAAIVSLLLLLAFVVYSLRKVKTFISNKKIIFLLFWFFIGIFPVIFLPAHKSSHYLLFILPTFWGSIGYICFNFFYNFKKIHKKLSLSLLVIFVFSTFLLSATSAKLGEGNYWASQRGKLAKKLINDVKNTYPTLPKGAILYFKNDPDYPFLTKEWGGTSNQVSIILNGSDALQLLYKDPILNVLYEDLGGLPNDITASQVYILVAKIN